MPQRSKENHTYWDIQYQQQSCIWGTGPSVLARFTAGFLKRSLSSEISLSIIDLGCGYGRDALYLAQNIRCSILGIDSSTEALKMAADSLPEEYSGKVRFQHGDFLQLQTGGKYDVVLSSNTYHLLKPQDRVKFREKIKGLLNPEGLFFMSTLSANDPEHSGKGDPVAGEANSYVDKIYLHLCTGEELKKDFQFLDVGKLQECEVEEPRSSGEDHHHVFWLLAGKMDRTVF